MSTEPETQTQEESLSVERRIRELNLNQFPDWMHTKAIQISRLLDTCESERDFRTFMLLQLLALQRRIHALEINAMDTDRWGEEVDEWNDYTQQWIEYFVDRLPDEKE